MEFSRHKYWNVLPFLSPGYVHIYIYVFLDVYLRFYREELKLCLGGNRKPLNLFF